MMVLVSKFMADVEKGSLIESVTPFLVGPGTEELAFDPKVSSIAICLGCNKKLCPDFFGKCSKCHLPMCGSKCEEAYFHRVFECSYVQQLTRGSIITSKEVMTTPIFYSIITLIRALMLEDLEPGLWEELTAQFVDTGRHASPMAQKRAATVIANLKSTLMIGDPTHAFSDFFDMENARDIYYVLRLRGLEFSGLANKLCTGFYLVARSYTHSCTPNVGHFQRLTDTGEILRLELISLCVSKKGTTITISYMSDTIYLSTDIRLQRLLAHFNLSCRCERCLSFSEFDSNFNRRFCPHYKRWNTPVADMDQQFPKVNVENGRITFPCKECGELDDVCRENIGVNDAAIYESLDAELNGIRDLSKKLEYVKNVANLHSKLVHAHHSTMFKVRLVLMPHLYKWMLKSDSMEFTNICVHKLLIRAAMCLKVYNKLMRGRVDPTRGVILFYMAQALRWWPPALRDVKEIKLTPFKDSFDWALFGAHIEALKIFQIFPPSNEHEKDMRQTLENQLRTPQNVAWVQKWTFPFKSIHLAITEIVERWATDQQLGNGNVGSGSTPTCSTSTSATVPEILRRRIRTKRSSKPSQNINVRF